MILKLKDILPNPFRNLLKNPLKELKLQELISSIQETDFWENVLVRKNSKGKYELAYGHHRLQAAINAGLMEADFIVKKLSDEKMLKIMDNENREAYGSDLLSVMESVEAVIYALKDKKIPPFKQADKARKDTLLYAPSVIPGKLPCDPNLGSHSDFAYTQTDVATFLNRTKVLREGKRPVPVITAAFAVLELEEHKVEGWNRKDLLRKYKALRTIPVDAILQDAISAKQTAHRRFEAEQKKTEQATSKGEEIKATINQLLAESLAAAKEEERLADDYAAAAKEKNVAEAKRLKEELKIREEEDKARGVLIAETKKEEKKFAEEEAKSEREAEAAEQRNAERARKRWLDHNATLIGKLNRTFNDDDSLYAEVTRWRLDKRTTEKQRSAVQLALRDLSARAANYNPFAGPAQKPKGEKQ
jgi:hypothetical protein